MTNSWLVGYGVSMFFLFIALTARRKYKAGLSIGEAYWGLPGPVEAIVIVVGVVLVLVGMVSQ